MKRLRTRLALAISGLALAASAIAAPAPVSTAALIEQGRAKFDSTCAPCHGAGPGDDGRAMLPGTDALRIKYKGEKPAVLEERTDLTPAMLKLVIREGVWSMPGFRPTEVTNHEMDAIAAYLVDKAKQPRPPAP